MSNSWEVVSPLPLPAPTARTTHLFAGATPARGTAERSDAQAPTPLDKCADYFAWKQLVDRTITAALLVVALPLMVLIAVAVLVFDGWPIMYRQRRVGQGGRIFWIWKFRTLCRNAEGETGAVWCTDGDPRVTALGRYLRAAHLDELPQFFNVLLGDMNLIGPRPERPTFVIALSRQLPHYHRRLAVRPGITGLAQLRLGYDQSVADVRTKVSLDIEYITTTSFLADMKILLMTVPHVIMCLLRRQSDQSPARHESSATQGASAVQHTPATLAKPRAARRSATEKPRATYSPHVSIAAVDNHNAARAGSLFVTMEGVSPAIEEAS